MFGNQTFIIDFIQDFINNWKTLIINQNYEFKSEVK